MAIIYALCCLACSAVNDFIFKIFADKRKSCGLFVSVVGLIWFLALLAFYKHIDDPAATILWGCISGTMSLSSNILLIESMAFQSAGVSSTIFRLNMVLVAIAACLFLGEPADWKLVIGIICALSAIIAFVPRQSAAASNFSQARTGFILAIIACLLRACMSLSYKIGFEHGADVNAVPCINAIFWIIGGILYTAIREHHIPKPDKAEITIGVVSGLFVAGIVFFMARMNACGNASIVNPIAQMSFLGTFVLSAIFLKEKMTPQKIAAVIIGCIAVIFLAWK